MGWAVVHRAGGLHQKLQSAALGLVPIAGALLEQTTSRSSARLLILSDTRLMLLGAGHLGPVHDGAGVMLDDPLHAIEVQLLSQTRFVIDTRRWSRPRVFALAEVESGPAVSLVAGLARLAESPADGATRRALARRVRRAKASENGQNAKEPRE